VPKASALQQTAPMAFLTVSGAGVDVVNGAYHADGELHCRLRWRCTGAAVWLRAGSDGRWCISNSSDGSSPPSGKKQTYYSCATDSSGSFSAWDVDSHGAEPPPQVDLQLEPKAATPAAAPPHRRRIYISLSSLLRQWDQKGPTLISEMPRDALFFFGSKRSWVFPSTEAEVKESKGENPKYTHDRYQPVRALILQKESRNEVFWLKPPGFVYNGSLFHGDPAAFGRASEWLQQLADPVTGQRYQPLRLDPDWWRQSFEKHSAEYTRHVDTIIRNFTNGAHDYMPVMELLHQSNPTLDIIH